MLTNKVKNVVFLRRFIKLPDTFKPNAILALKPGLPVMITMPNAIDLGMVISPRRFKWNSIQEKNSSTSYRRLIDYLAENLPQNRKFLGGFFYIRINHMKKDRWQDDEDLALVNAIYPLSVKVDDSCLINLWMTIGEYAGDEMSSALINTVQQSVVFKR